MGMMMRIAKPNENARTTIKRTISGAFVIKYDLELNQEMRQEARITRIAEITAKNGMATLGSVERRRAVREMLYGEGSEVEEWKDGKVDILDEKYSTSVGINVDSRTRLVVNLRESEITMIVGPIKIEDGTPKAYETKVGINRDLDEEKTVDIAVNMIRDQIFASYDKPEITARLQEAMCVLIKRDINPLTVN